MVDIKKLEAMNTMEDVLTKGGWSVNLRTGLLKFWSKNEWIRKQAYKFQKDLVQCGATEVIGKDGYLDGVVIDTNQFEAITDLFDARIQKLQESFKTK